ncbi:hypothetical protein AK812_SmicGene48281, partial [Symbiodinium microadriaticum]
QLRIGGRSHEHDSSGGATAVRPPFESGLFHVHPGSLDQEDPWML